MTEPTMIPPFPSESPLPVAEVPAYPAAQISRGLDSGPRPMGRITPQHCACGGKGGEGCTCNAGSLGYVYAIGSIHAKFPSQSVEKEFIQVWSPTRYDGPIPQQVIYEVLSQGRNLYLAREMCWVFANQGVDLYLIQPRSQIELTDLILSLASTRGDVDFDLLIGTVGPVAPPEMCIGLQVPVVTATQVFTFSEKAFLENIRNYAASIHETVTVAAAQNAFDILIRLTDNAGSSNEHRAINYVTFKSVDLYVLETQMEAKTPSFQLTDVTARPSPLSNGRQIVNVIFIYTNTHTTAVEKYFTSVDVTGIFPYLVTPIAPFYDHP